MLLVRVIFAQEYIAKFQKNYQVDISNFRKIRLLIYLGKQGLIFNYLYAHLHFKLIISETFNILETGFTNKSESKILIAGGGNQFCDRGLPIYKKAKL